MGDLLVAHVLWLLGQDEQWMRPRAGALPIAAVAGALVDVVDAGAARWVDRDGEAAVEPTGARLPDGLLGGWAQHLGSATSSGPVAVIHAVNALGGHGLWEAVGADLSRRGHADDVPRPIRRWKEPRRRPRRESVDTVRTRLLAVVHGRLAPTRRDRHVLAVAYSVGVAEHVLSSSAFPDSSLLAPTEAFLEGSDLVRRLEPAVSYLTSLGPGMGVSTPAASPPWGP